MGKGGAARKLTLNGLDRELTSDNDPKLTIGGTYVGEKQETTGRPFFVMDKSSGVLSGIEERVSHADGTLDTLLEAMEKCALEGPVSCLYITADGTKYTPSGGAMIIPDGASDGMMSLREGKVVYSLVPADGVWLKM